MHQVRVVGSGAVTAAVAREFGFNDPIGLKSYRVLTIIRIRRASVLREKLDFALTPFVLSLIQLAVKLNLPIM